MNPEASEPMIYIKTLTERIDKHSYEVKEGFDKTFIVLNEIRTQQMRDSAEIRKELESIRIKAAEDRLDFYKQITQVKEIASSDNHKLSLKIAFIMGAIGLAAGGAGSFVERKFSHPPERVIRYEPLNTEKLPYEPR